MKNDLDYPITEHMLRKGKEVFGENVNWQVSRETHPEFFTLANDELANLMVAIHNLISLSLLPQGLTEPSLCKGITWLIKGFATSVYNQAHLDNARATKDCIREKILTDIKISDEDKSQFIFALDSSDADERMAKELVNFSTALDIKIAERTKSINGECNLKSIEDAFLALLEKRGKAGALAKKELTEVFKQWSGAEYGGLNNRLQFWINTERKPKPFHISKAFITFLTVFYKEELQQKIKFSSKYPTAANDQIMQNLEKIASPGNNYKKTEKSELKVYDKGNNPIGTIQIPLEANFDPNSKTSKMLKRQMDRLDKIHAPRLYEYLIEKALSCYSEGRDGYDIKIPGRGKQLAKDLGFTDGKAITAINDLVALLNVLEFDMPGIKSKLISVAECEKGSIFSNKGGWLMSILPPMRPSFCLSKEEKKNLKKRLLILILKNAPLVGHGKYHARQYRLKWKIAAEATKQSKRVAQEGSFIITKSRWVELMKSTNMPEKLLPEILKAITGPKGYLEQKSPERFSLREAAKQKFLESQGRYRIEKSLSGKNGAVKKIKKLKKFL